MAKWKREIIPAKYKDKARQLTIEELNSEFTSEEKAKERELFREWVLKTCFPKELKALEIIKNKGLNVETLTQYLQSYAKNNFVKYWNKHYWNFKQKHLSQEEYDLLEEVLKDE